MLNPQLVLGIGAAKMQVGLIVPLVVPSRLVDELMPWPEDQAGSPVVSSSVTEITANSKAPGPPLRAAGRPREVRWCRG